MADATYACKKFIDNILKFLDWTYYVNVYKVYTDYEFILEFFQPTKKALLIRTVTLITKFKRIFTHVYSWILKEFILFIFISTIIIEHRKEINSFHCQLFFMVY